MRLIWVRHGETLWNRQFRLQGSSDVPLSDVGHIQAKQLAERITERPDYLFVSPLARTQEFAAPLAEKYGLRPHVDHSLCEMSFGRWEGLRYADMDQEMQKQYEAWCLDPVNVCPPEGESSAALAERVKRLLANIKSSLGEEENAVVVTHGGIIRVAVTLAMQFPAVAAGRLQISPASVTILDYYGDHWYLVKLNDTCHLTKERSS